MLRIFAMRSFLLLACTGPSINGYTLGQLSSGRGQEYSGVYRTGGFVGTKDARGDYSESGASHGYSVVSGGPGYSSTTGSSYGSDSGYADPSVVASGHSGAYDSGNSQGSNGLSVSPYPSELRGGQATSSELVGASYSTGGSTSGGGIAYSTGSGADSRIVGQVTSGLVDYSESSAAAGGHGAGSHAGGSSIVERGEYSSPQPQSSGLYGSYTIGGAPKAAAYVSSSGLVTPGGQATLSNGIVGSYSSSPGFSPVAHRPIVSSSHSSQASNHPASPGLGFATSGSSLKGFLANVHVSNGHNYAGHASSHRGSPGHHLYAAASNPSPGYTPRGPASGYFASNGPYNRGNGSPGGKIFVVKEGNALHHAGHAYPGEHHAGYSVPTFGSSNSGYKMRNVGSASSHGPPSFPNGYSPAAAYVPSSLASSHNGNKHAGSFFGFL